MASSNATVSLCAPSSFANPTVFGAQILSIDANLVTGYNDHIPDIYWFNHPSINVTDATFCNVTVTYTHPGEGDNVIVTAWLPPADAWNERLQAVGGGGWVAGGASFILSQLGLAGGMAEGYATLTTDGGLGTASDASPWGLLTPGNVNLYLLENLASRSLYDEALIGKSLIKDFYSKPAKYSYWSGCSQGGRQGLMLAQRYPDLYDGIAASAPAINWNAFFIGMIWPQLIMNIAGEYPHPCELDYITEAAVAACDGLDGVVDGLITDIKGCKFDPSSLVGTTFNCSETGKNIQISQIAATVANATWSGPQTVDGRFLWYGPNRGADLSGDFTGGQALATTTCTANSTCVGVPTDLGAEWITLFIEKNPDFNLSSITHEQYDEIFHEGCQQYSSIIDTTDPDLSAFKAAGGKMLGFHGLADQIIPTSGTEDYYDKVTALVPNVHDFYRMFEAPGVQHCANGNGGQPTAVFDALVAWVENGTVPHTLPAVTNYKGTVFNSILCPYPAIAKYNGVGNPTSVDSFSCA